MGGITITEFWRRPTKGRQLDANHFGPCFSKELHVERTSPYTFCMLKIRRSTPWETRLAFGLFLAGIVHCGTITSDPTDANSKVSPEKLVVTFREYHEVENRNLSNQPEPVRAMATRAFRALGQIESIWHQKPRPIPARYHASLSRDVVSLDHVLRHPDNSEFSADLLSGTVRSLEIKADRAATFPHNWPDLVDVTVDTKHNGQGVNGLKILYCLRWQAPTPNWLRFKEVSTPATESLAPSVYIFHAGSVQTEPIEIGRNGESVNKVSIEIP
jgi:hypothetical protein